jgi:hypothetical protein
LPPTEHGDGVRGGVNYSKKDARPSNGFLTQGEVVFPGVVLP